MIQPSHQQKALDCLASLDALIVTYEHLIDTLRELKKGLRQNIFVQQKGGKKPIKTETLNQAYREAIAQNRDSFTVIEDGETYELLTGYAKYLLEFLTSQNVQTFTLTQRKDTCS